METSTSAFASFCDFFANVSRGWVLGWNASTLTPLAANQLNDKLAPSPTNDFFLSSVWMSGNGLAASSTAAFSSRREIPTSGSYDSVNNLSESVVNLSSDLTSVMDFFTPSNVNTLDANDADFSAGGVLLIPAQSGPVANLAVALGKDGRMYLMNQQNLGKFTPGGPDKVLGTFALTQHCWCAESYYTGSDGVGRVVSSAGHYHHPLETPDLTKRHPGQGADAVGDLASGQDAGFFTSVSSNGTQAGTAVIWAVSRPTDTNPANVLLYAFNAANGSLHILGKRRDMAQCVGKREYRAGRRQRASICSEQQTACHLRPDNSGRRGRHVSASQQRANPSVGKPAVGLGRRDQWN